MGTLSSVKPICGRLHHPEDQFWWVQWDPIFERSPIWEVDHVWHPGIQVKIQGSVHNMAQFCWSESDLQLSSTSRMMSCIYLCC